MQKPLFTLSFGFLVLILATQHGFAQTQQCGPRAQILTALSQQFGEQPRAIGLAGGDAVMELFVNPETGTWTMTATRADAVTCLIASGMNFDTVPQGAPV